jgi:hypothetical protein
MTALLHEALSSSSLRRNISVLSLSLLMVAGALFAAPSALAQQQLSTSETVGAEGPQTIIHITKDGTNSYLISEGSSSIGTFDTTYRIAGERSALRASEELIINTITGCYRYEYWWYSSGYYYWPYSSESFCNIRADYRKNHERT